MFARYGVTTVHHEGGSLLAMQKVRANEELKHRISYEATGKELDAMISAGIQAVTRWQGHAGPRLYYRGFRASDLANRELAVLLRRVYSYPVQ